MLIATTCASSAYHSGPLDYKIPGLRNIPRKLNVTLLKDSKGTKAVYSSKVIRI
jgi:xanthine dehydrogenase molybdopterin-binding subunit B